MNYPGLEHLRADVAALSNAMCDVRMLLNRLESQHRHDAATLTGVCGSDVDQVLVDFSADVQWLKGRGVQVERYNLAQQPMSFVQNEKAKAFLEASGAEGLPLLLLDGETVMAGRYPKRAELARWFGIPLEKVGLAPISCCGGNTSCC